MQYNVPQFIEVEDKIIGPLTLKEFLIILGGGLVIFMWYSIFNVTWPFFVLTLPTAVFFGIIAKGKYNGRPALYYAMSFIKFYFVPKSRIFKRTVESSLILKKAPPQEVKKVAAVAPEEAVTRLHKLAYLLDQKTAEEERIIHSGKPGERWINQI